MKKALWEGIKGVGMILGAAATGGIILSIVATMVMLWLQLINRWGWIQ